MVGLTASCERADDFAARGVGSGAKEHVMRAVTRSIVALAIAAVFCGTAAAKGGGNVKPDKGLDMEPEAAGGPPSKTLERAIKLYDKKDFYSASIELKKVLDGESGDDAKNKQRAEFFMGKALYQMGFYAGSLKYFDDIVKAGDQHTYHGAALKWLAALSRVLPETSGILQKIGTYDVSALNDPSLASVHDELLFLLGRHFYNKGGDGDFDKAIGLFRQVAKDSAFYIKAKFFEGVTHVRKLDGPSAVAAFKDILTIGAERESTKKVYSVDDIDNYNQLAELQMARIFYSTQQFDKSIRYFEKLDEYNADWAESLFEASWAYFMKTLNSKALGNIHTLNAPYFENSFYPEAILLRAVIYYKYCLYDQAEEAISDYNEKYGPLTKNLKDLAARFEDNAEFYEKFAKPVRAGKAGLDPITQRLVMSQLNDKTLLKTFAWVDELNRELTQYQKSDKAWQTTAVAGEVFQELTLQQSVAQGDAGKVARERIKRYADELGVLSRDGLRIKLEILNAKENKVSTEMQGIKVSSDHREEPIVIDDEHFQWKFNGEYWKDELGYYRFKIRSRCPKQ
jgi:hypothetical protein